MEILRLSQLSLDPYILATPWLEDPAFSTGRGDFTYAARNFPYRFSW